LEEEEKKHRDRRLNELEDMLANGEELEKEEQEELDMLRKWKEE